MTLFEWELYRFRVRFPVPATPEPVHNVTVSCADFGCGFGLHRFNQASLRELPAFPKLTTLRGSLVGPRTKSHERGQRPGRLLLSTADCMGQAR